MAMLRVRPTLVLVAAIAALLAGYYLLVSRTTPQVGPSRSGFVRAGLVALGDLAVLDPARATSTTPIVATWLLHARLVSADEKGQVSPMAAKSWSASADLREWRFDIDKSVTFWGEKPRAITPADVRYSLERALRQPGYAPSLLDEVEGVADFVAGRSPAVSGIAIDATSVRFRMRAPMAFLPQRLAAGFFSVVPVGTSSDDPSPTGAGPYRLEKWDRAAQVVMLVRRSAAQAAGGPQYADRIELRVVSSEAVAAEEVGRGVLDWVMGHSTLALAGERVASKPGVKLVRIPANDIRIVAFNLESGPLASRADVRRHLNALVDREDLAKAVGGGTAVLGPVPGAPSQCRTAGERATPPGADEMRFELLTLPDREQQTIAQILKAQWEARGYRVDVVVAAADFFDRVVRGDYQAALGYFGPFLPTAEQYLWLYRSSAIPVPNVMRYRSEAFDKGFLGYIGESATSSQIDKLSALTTLLCAEAPAAWLVQLPFVTLSREQVSVRFLGAVPIAFEFTRP